MNRKLMLGIALLMLLVAVVACAEQKAPEKSAEQVGAEIGSAISGGVLGVIAGAGALKDQLAKDPVIGGQAEKIAALVDKDTKIMLSIKDAEDDSASLTKAISDFIRKEESKLGIVESTKNVDELFDELDKELPE